nr:reverse transcriptase domain-containing protein [Tanacetum cinerariifolium]
MKRRPEECYDLIENITAHHNDWDTSARRSESSSSITSFDHEIAALKAEMAEINKNLMRVLQVNQQVKAVTPNCETCGGHHSYNDWNNLRRNHFFQGASHGQNHPPAYQALTYQASGYQALVHQPPIHQPQVVTTNEFPNYMKANDAILKNMQTNMTSLINSNFELKNMFGQFMKMNTASSLGLETLPVWSKLFLPELSPTCMTLELANRLISRPDGVAEDVFVKVGTFHFPTDFVVVDFDADPRVPLILERSFLKTGRALIDVFKGELTLRVGKEAITFNLDQTLRYSANYNDMTANRIDVINMAWDSDFLLEEVDAFLALEDYPSSPEVDHSYFY